MPTAMILGASYPTLIMPDGKEWTAININWSGAGALYSGDADGIAYGRMYNWTADGSAVNAALANGWRWPSEDDYIALFQSLGASWVTDRWSFIGREMKEAGTAYWDVGNTGTNTSGFGIRGSGFVSSGTSVNRRIKADMVTSTTEGASPVRNVSFQFDYDGAPYEDAARRIMDDIGNVVRGSLRLVRDVGIQGVYPQKDGVWRHANEVYVAHGGEWRKANRVFVADAGAWREVQ